MIVIFSLKQLSLYEPWTDGSLLDAKYFTKFLRCLRVAQIFENDFYYFTCECSIRDGDGIESVEVTKMLIHSVRNAHARYVEVLEKQSTEVAGQLECDVESFLEHYPQCRAASKHNRHRQAYLPVPSRVHNSKSLKTQHKIPSPHVVSCKFFNVRFFLPAMLHRHPGASTLQQLWTCKEGALTLGASLASSDASERRALVRQPPSQTKHRSPTWLGVLDNTNDHENNGSRFGSVPKSAFVPPLPDPSFPSQGSDLAMPAFLKQFSIVSLLTRSHAADTASRGDECQSNHLVPFIFAGQNLLEENVNVGNFVVSVLFLTLTGGRECITHRQIGDNRGVWESLGDIDSFFLWPEQQGALGHGTQVRCCPRFGLRPPELPQWERVDLLSWPSHSGPGY
ncbi:hypothetical protein PR048_020011 [Dryococelus australis]|uniref:Uncharacterized protein n=1 Tax=Dryococelus australis TaxID=614101 RepID=A0ABQ9H545_9NEOP|nr:hypothetical protein PR048_020011 [Dryococelus australis]